MITEQQKEILNTYAQIKLDIKALEAKADELNPQVIEFMQDNEIGELEISNLGKLSMASRRTWKYSKEIKEIEDDLKAKKKNAEQFGEADYTEKHYVVFKGAKEE